MMVKVMMGIMVVILALVGLRMFVKDHNHFFVASEAIHAAGILVLIFKLATKRNCSGNSPSYSIHHIDFIFFRF